MSGETVTMSSSGNIIMLIYCSYEKWERRLKCGLQLKRVSYTLKDEFKCPTEAQALAATQGGPIQKRYEDNVKDVKAKVLIQIATDDVANDLIEDVELARDMKKILDREFKLGNKEYEIYFSWFSFVHNTHTFIQVNGFDNCIASHLIDSVTYRWAIGRNAS